jgi:hypothetical protein
MSNYILTKDIYKIASGLNIEGCRPTEVIPAGCLWYNIVQAIDEPLEGFTFDDVMKIKNDNKYDLIEQSIKSININIFIDDLVKLINKIKVNHKKLLVHVHQYTGTTILNEILHEKTGVDVILDETNFFESPINYLERYPDIDGLLSLSQCAGLGVKAGTWIIPTNFFNFDVHKNIISINTAGFTNSIEKYIEFEFVKGNILVVNDLWNPTLDSMDHKILLTD